MMNRKSLLWTLGTGMMSLAFVFSAEAATVNLRILETSDLHMHLMNYDYEKSRIDNTVGAVKLATIIKQQRNKNKNILLVDDGDLIQGTAVADYVHSEYKKNGNKLDGHIAYELLSELNFDVAALGNHEFNYGLDFLNQALHSANFPVLGANVYNVDKKGNPTSHYFKSHVILNRTLVDTDGHKHNVKIGVIGVLTPQIVNWDREKLVGKVTTTDIIETTKQQVKKLRSKVDVILVLAHSGIGDAKYFDKEANTGYQLTQIKGVDAVATGHSHSRFPSESYATFPDADIQKGTINGVPIVEPGFYGSDLGVLDLKLDVDDNEKVTVADGSGKIIPIYKKEGKRIIPLVENDPDAVKFVTKTHENTIKYMGLPVGQITQDLSSYYSISTNTALIQVINNAQLDYARTLYKGTPQEKLPLLSASAPFKAGWHDAYTYVGKGDISLKNISDIYMYPNTLAIVKINGSQVREWVEKSADFYSQIDPDSSSEQDLMSNNEPSYNLDIMANVTYKIDLTQPSRYNRSGNKLSDQHRIYDLRYNGKPIDPKQDFLVVTNNYRASGGGSFPGLDGSNVVYETTDTLPDVLKAYMIDHSPLTVDVPHIFSFKKNFNKATVTFKTSAKLKKNIPNNLEFLRDNSDGSIQVKLK